MRLQLALNVDNLDEAIAFYRKAFGVDVHKRRPGYANFEVVSPPLKLVLFENKAATERPAISGVRGGKVWRERFSSEVHALSFPVRRDGEWKGW